MFRLHALLVVIVPEVELAALALPEDSVPRACALHCVGDARTRISMDPGRTPAARIAQARRLARSVHVLCDHYENGDHQCPKGPERAAYVRLLTHCPGCRDCRAVNEAGEAVGMCDTRGRLYEEYRRARRAAVASREQSGATSEASRRTSVHNLWT
ncbi:DUF6415 family natural product biosynthesis protein [Streptomyces massasporeus]|uniref:DUF6415 family natural product biosynthesis protein n=1 Tax=Streptomyces massasporeus TaxID=67324 RepID=UPI0033EB4D14